MAVVDLFDDGGDLPLQFFGKPDAKDFTDPVGGQPPQSDFAAPLEDLVDGKVAFEDEVAAVLDLGDSVEARQVHVCAFVLGKLRTQVEGPVIELFADDRGAQTISGGLQGGHVVYGEEGVVVFTEADSRFGQFA